MYICVLYIYNINKYIYINKYYIYIIPVLVSFLVGYANLTNCAVPQGWSVPIASRFVLTAPNVWTANSALPAGQ